MTGVYLGGVQICEVCTYYRVVLYLIVISVMLTAVWDIKDERCLFCRVLYINSISKKQQTLQNDFLNLK